MKHHGRVCSINGQGEALVQLDSISQCQRCRRGQGCGVAGLNARRDGITLIAAQPAQAADAGQQVVIEIDDHGSLWLLPVLGAYGLPLAGLLSGAFVAGWLTSTPSLTVSDMHTDVMTLVSAVTGFYGGLFAWRKLSAGPLAKVLSSAERSLCLQSARIVAINPPSE